MNRRLFLKLLGLLSIAPLVKVSATDNMIPLKRGMKKRKSFNTNIGTLSEQAAKAFDEKVKKAYAEMGTLNNCINS
jgi:hypothetical protein